LLVARFARLSHAAWLGHPQLALTHGVDKLIVVAAEEVGWPADVASICIPALAGLGELLAMVGFWSGWLWADILATLGLMAMFTSVAYVHWRAQTTVSAPITFVAIATLKLVTTRRRRTKKD
jgi:hypothetical protein